MDLAQKDILAVNPQDKLAPTWAEIKKAQWGDDTYQSFACVDELTEIAEFL